MQTLCRTEDRNLATEHETVSTSNGSIVTRQSHQSVASTPFTSGVHVLRYEFTVTWTLAEEAGRSVLKLTWFNLCRGFM